MNIFAKKPYLLALLVTAALALWLWSGQKTEVASAPEKTLTPSNPAPPLMQVRVREQRAEPLTRTTVITGYTAPSRIATLRSEIEARVEKIGAERGRRVQQGEVIVQLAVDDRQLRLQEAHALVKQREFDYQAKLSLSTKGYQTEVQIAEALALLESAKTLVEQAKVALGNTVIRAPFDGVLVDRLVEQGDYLSMGDVVAVVSDGNPFLAVGELSELERFYVRVGSKATVKLITGQMLTGTIRFIAVTTDPATRTFKIEVEFPNPADNIPAGMTCEIHISLETVLAHRLSSALLALDDTGVLGVKTVNADNRVEFYPAKFARSTTEGIWLMELPERLRFITVGQGFVRAGDWVQPVTEKERLN